MNDSFPSKEMLTCRQAADRLGITPESVRNWTRQGLLNEYEQCFIQEEVDNLKDRIDRGKIDRLTQRANKSNSTGMFVPSEYISSRKSIAGIHKIVGYILSENLAPEPALFLLACNLLIDRGDIKLFESSSPFSFPPGDFRRISVRKIMCLWYMKLEDQISEIPDEAVNSVLKWILPEEEDILGIIYQSLLHEGLKSGSGSYYTPRDLVDDLLVGEPVCDSKILDPCCGTGQFLLALADRLDDPFSLHGYDLDEIAVRIARINMLLKFPCHDLMPNIYHLDALMSSGSSPSGFDLIATNPPWGAKYSKEALEKIQRVLPEVRASDSFSWFILASYRMLKDGGRMRFVLPESITNVGTHKAVREFIIKNTIIDEITILGKKFKNVMSPVITLKMIKKHPGPENCLNVSNGGDTYMIEQKRFLKNRNFLFDIRVDDRDLTIIDKLFNRDYVTLLGRAEWALGIVTGDNRRFISGNRDDHHEPIFRGSDIFPFTLKCPTNFIEYRPELFQQTAPDKTYRAKEKLFYRFISRKLIFARDDEGRLALNSANILIPKIENYPLRIILAFLNSKLFNFYFLKKFNSVKVLRGDLETLPFPILKEEKKKELMKIVEGIEAGALSVDVLDDYVFCLYGLSGDDISLVEDTV